MVKLINEFRYEKSGVILFNSYSKIGTEVLSNLHLCRMEYEGKVFHSSEQLFYWLRLTGYPEHQEALLQCPTPKETKNMGDKFMKKLGIADDIYRDVQLLRLAIRVKYNCCREFKVFLDNHPNDYIVEYAWWGDNEYGCVDEERNLKYDWKQRQIQDIETALFRKYRANRPIFGMDKLDWKEKRLQEDIDELRKDL